jgi:hypothetical protein
LRPAGAHAFGHRLLADVLRFHGFLQMPSDDALDGDDLHFTEDSFLFKKAIEARSAVIEGGGLVAHFRLFSCLRLLPRGRTRRFQAVEYDGPGARHHCGDWGAYCPQGMRRIFLNLRRLAGTISAEKAEIDALYP